MADEQKVQRIITTRRFLDKRRDPWEYVDEELPTTTIKLRNPGRRVETRAPLGTIPGSYRMGGTHYDFGPGTYSLRITRLDVGVAGTQGFRGTLYRWHLRHSREGTLSVLTFGAPGRVLLQGHALAPVVSVGPGTLVWGWLGDHLGGGGTHVTYTQSLEAIPGQAQGPALAHFTNTLRCPSCGGVCEVRVIRGGDIGWPTHCPLCGAKIPRKPS